MGHVHANTRKSIHTEEYLFQESLVECHYQASHKTTQTKSGFLGLASKATLFMKNKKEPYIIYLICPCLKSPPSTKSPVVFRAQTQSLCRRWDILGDRGTVSPSITSRQAHLPQPRQECCSLHLQGEQLPKWHIWGVRDTWLLHLPEGKGGYL